MVYINSHRTEKYTEYNTDGSIVTYCILLYKPE
jgi:hypothetical protein